MVCVKSLKDVMEDVSKNLDTVFVHAPTESKLTEFEALVRTDNVLSSLQKQYLDAKSLRLKTQKEYGVYDSMTEMAIWNEDSAWCAMQTRFLELRDNRAAMAKVKTVMEEEKLAQKAKREKEDREKALDYYYSMQKIQTIKEKFKIDYALMLWVLIMLDSIRLEFFRIQNTYKFNSCAA